MTSAGQALVEYLLILAFITTISLNLIKGFSDFMKTSVGSLGHELSVNLSSGVCPRMCFYSGYRNGNRAQ